MARANKPSDPNVVTLTNARGAILRAVRRSGQIVARRGSGGHHVVGYVAPGLSARDVAKLWRADERFARILAEGGRVTPADCGDVECACRAPIVTQAKADARKRAAARRAEKSSAERAAQEAREAQLTTLADGIAYVVECARAQRAPIRADLHYVYAMARFHGGASVNLGGPIMAATLLQPNASREFVAALDAIADEVARRAFGSDLRGALVWGRALGKL